MTILEEIISLIGKLDYTWYTSVEKKFIAEQGYDPDTKKVKRIVPDFYSHYDQETGEGDTSDWDVNSGVEEYAWDYSYIDYPWFNDRPETEDEKLPALDNKLPVQGYIISRHLLKIIGNYINESLDVVKQDGFITKVLTIVLGKVNEIKEVYGDTEYPSVALHFYKSFKAEISGEYSHIRRAANKKRDFETFLKTDLSEEVKNNSQEIKDNSHQETPDDSQDEQDNFQNTQELNYVINKPIFREVLVSEIYDILKVHFQKGDHVELLRILQTGENVNRKLHFDSSANQLAEAFRLLFNKRIISGCLKNELAIWIHRNFTYRNNKNSSEFNIRTLEDYISSKESKCKNPILDVKKDEVTGQYSIINS